MYPEIKRFIISDAHYGLNLEIKSITLRLIFPSFLIQNSFKLQFIDQLKSFLKKTLTFDDIQRFISEKVISQEYNKKGGFTKRNLELLRFYIFNFDNVMDFNANKFLPYYNSYVSKYIHLRRSNINNRLFQVQNYSRYLLLPKFRNFGLNVGMFRSEEESLVNQPASRFGMLFNHRYEKEFSFFFTPYNRVFKSNYIDKICFFENLDLFHEDPRLKKLINRTEDILELYYSFKEDNFTDTAVSFAVDFSKNKKFINQLDNLDLLIHLYNTRKLPINHEIHPVSKYLITYRNKIVNFYGSTNFFIYIYDSRHKSLSRFSDLLVKLLRNTFSNGYIIQGDSYLLISTFLFRQDFEQAQQSLFEFVYSFKLEIKLFENLHLIPFSFYQIPPSIYFNSADNQWYFPNYQEDSLENVQKYQIKNLELERSRLQNAQFKQRRDEYVDTLTHEINSLTET